MGLRMQPCLQGAPSGRHRVSRAGVEGGLGCDSSPEPASWHRGDSCWITEPSWGGKRLSSVLEQIDQGPRPGARGLPGQQAWGSPPLSLGTLFSSLVGAFPGL